MGTVRTLGRGPGSWSAAASWGRACAHLQACLRKTLPRPHLRHYLLLPLLPEQVLVEQMEPPLEHLEHLQLVDQLELPPEH